MSGGFSNRTPYNQENTPMSTAPTTLEEARDRIDDIDRRIVELIAERYAVVDTLCEMKAENGDTVKDEDREQELLDHVASIAEENDLSPALAQLLYEKILAHSVRRQRRRRSADDASAPSTEAAAPSGDALPANGTAPTDEPATPTPASTAEAVPRPDDAPTDRPHPRVARTSADEQTVIHVGDAAIGGENPTLIAGPCSVESRDQILRTAEAVAEAGGDLLRGGAFKPRTSPYSFQGLGEEGLDLLAEAGRRFDLPVITEVLGPGDVDAVSARADVLQIGARNMQNFPLLKAVGAADTPAMLKRGMMASIEEWLKAAEYIVAHGNPHVFLCERGIKTFESATRYTLDLSSVPVAQERTHLPVVVDPSHAAGTRRWVPALVRAALGAGAHGVMVEAHPNPDEALSDGPQSLTTETLGEIGRLFAREPVPAGR
jgi:3-deoxy-7-phosphoheptulonate synthase